MDVGDYAGRYMAGEAAYNAGDGAPFAAMFADGFTLNGTVMTRDQIHGVFATNVAAGMRFRTVGLSVYGAFLIVHGELTLPGQPTVAQVGVLRFDEAGSIVEFTMLGGYQRSSLRAPDL